MRRKAALFPDHYPIDGMQEVRTVRDFDDAITARFCGFRDAADYYEQSSALQLAGAIRRPTLILTAQDDPFVPFASFKKPEVRENPSITLIAPRHGGHCAFISSEGGEGRFWAESRIVEFCAEHSKIIRRGIKNGKQRRSASRYEEFRERLIIVVAAVVANVAVVARQYVNRYRLI